MMSGVPLEHFGQVVGASSSSPNSTRSVLPHSQQVISMQMAIRTSSTFIITYLLENLVLVFLTSTLLEAVKALQVAGVAGLEGERRDTGATASTVPVAGKLWFFAWGD